jgi:hypothetical protein
MFKYEKELLSLTPPEFKLENYASTSKLTPKEWELNLSYRTSILIYQRYLSIEWAKKSNLDNIFYGANNREIETDDVYKTDAYDDIFNQKNIKDTVLNGNVKPNNSEYCISINPYASNDQLEREFKHWLQDKRKQSDIVFKGKEFTPAQYKKMHQCNLLPYLDLIKWHELNQTCITNGQAGELIFPDDKRGAVGERIRNTTKIWAERVFEKSSINILFNLKSIKSGKKKR